MSADRRFAVRNLLILAMFALSAVAFMDRTNISIAGPAIRDELGLNDVRLGWVISAFLLGYAAFQMVGGWLAYRFGPRQTLALAVVWWGIFSALTTVVSRRLSHALLLLIAIRFALGAGEAVMYPASNQFVARWIPVSERGRANGWIFAGIGAGAGLSIPLLAEITNHYGWRASFWFSAAAGLVGGALWYLCARDTPEEHNGVSAAELRYIQANREMNTRGQASASDSLSWGRLIFNRNVMALTACYATFGYVAWIFFGWFFIYLAQARGVNLKSNELISMVPFLAMAACCIAGGMINDALSKRYGMRFGRCGIGAVVFVLTAIFLMVGPRVHSAYLGSIILASGAGTMYLAQSSFWSISADLSGRRSGLVSGVMNFANQIAGALTASLTPYLASRYGWNAAFSTAAVVMIAGATLWLTIDPGGMPVSSQT